LQLMVWVASLVDKTDTLYHGKFLVVTVGKGNKNVVSKTPTGFFFSFAFCCL